MKLLWLLSKGSRDDNVAPALDASGSEGASRLVIWSTLLVLGAFVGWAYVAEIDEITRAPGEVIASSRTQLVQSEDGGRLEQLLVREGDRVEAGQVLARLDHTRARAAYLETRAKAAGLSARASRLRAEMLDQQPVFGPLLDEYPDLKANQMALLDRRGRALREQVNALQHVQELLQQEFGMSEPLLATGDISRTELLRLQRQIAENAAEVTNLRNEWFQQVQAELSEVEAELASLLQQLAQRRSLLDQTELRAPRNGIVKNVRVTTVGGVIGAGEEVLQIVPLEDDLLIEARINPGDIAFLQPGLPARVKIDAYDFTIFGDLAGELVFISADTIDDGLREGEQPYFRIRVRTDGREFSATPGQELEIQTGMTAMVEINTGRRTVLEYLTKPIIKTLSQSLGER